MHFLNTDMRTDARQFTTSHTAVRTPMDIRIRRPAFGLAMLGYLPLGAATIRIGPGTTDTEVAPTTGPGSATHSTELLLRASAATALIDRGTWATEALQDSGLAAHSTEADPGSPAAE